MTDSYAIRTARPDDLAALPAIERVAAAVFRTTPYAYLADDDLISAEVDLAQEYVWVAVDPDDQPIGFAIVHVLDESVHLHELDVHPGYARQGLGRRLIATVAGWARARGATALTLTTFADIAWNGPYYARLGFRTLDLATISPGLQAVRQSEAEAGLPNGDDRHWVSGNLGVSEWLLTGTTPDGVRLHVRGCDHWEFRDGKVLRKDSYWKIVEQPT